MKKKLVVSSSIICLMAIYNLLVFLLNTNYTKNFWTGYIFIMVGFVMMLVSFVLTFATPKREKVTGLPLPTLSVYYFIIISIIANALMFLNISFIAIFLPLIIVSLIYLMVFIPALFNLLEPKKNEKVEK